MIIEIKNENIIHALRKLRNLYLGRKPLLFGSYTRIAWFIATNSIRKAFSVAGFWCVESYPGTVLLYRADGYAEDTQKLERWASKYGTIRQIRRN